eukprot:gene8235-10121_t
MSSNNLEQFKGKLCMITGANEGLGKETAKILSKIGMRIIMACRDLKKAEVAAQEIKQFSNSNDIMIMKLDLGSFASIRNFVKEFKQLNLPLDILINNAGIYGPPYSRTVDGFESQFGVNHLGPFLLTNLLLPCLERAERPRIVVLASRAHYHGNLVWDNLSCSEKEYSPIIRYNASKLGSVLFCFELQRRLEERGSKIVVNTLHPGVINTNLFKDLNGVVRFFLASSFMSLFITSVEDGAQAVVQLALGVAPIVQGVKGKYFNISQPQLPSKFALDKKNWLKLWEISSDLVSIDKDIKLVDDDDQFESSSSSTIHRG